MALPRIILKNPKPKVRLVVDYNDHSSDFKYQLDCINHTNTDITIVFRDNLPITYHRCNDGSIPKSTFIIRKTYQFFNYTRINDVIRNLGTMFQDGSESMNDDLQIVYKVLTDQQLIGKFSAVASVHIDRTILVDDLIRDSHCYVAISDLMIYQGLYHADMVHPYSVKARSTGLYEDINPAGVGLGITIELIDNEDSVAARYMSIAGRIYEVPVYKDVERPSGVYMTDNHKGQTHLSYTALADIGGGLGMHRSIEEAMTAGNVELTQKSQLKELEHVANTSKIAAIHAVAESKSSMLKLQADHDAHNLTIKREFEVLVDRLKRSGEEQRLQHEEAMLQIRRTSEESKLKYDDENRRIERERSRTKDEYERVSYDRKNSYEGLKTAGLLLASGLSIFAILQKAK